MRNFPVERNHLRRFTNWTWESSNFVFIWTLSKTLGQSPNWPVNLQALNRKTELKPQRQSWSSATQISLFRSVVYGHLTRIIVLKIAAKIVDVFWCQHFRGRNDCNMLELGSFFSMCALYRLSSIQDIQHYTARNDSKKYFT